MKNTLLSLLAATTLASAQSPDDIANAIQTVRGRFPENTTAQAISAMDLLVTGARDGLDPTEIALTATRMAQIVWNPKNSQELRDSAQRVLDMLIASQQSPAAGNNNQWQEPPAAGNAAKTESGNNPEVVEKGISLIRWLANSAPKDKKKWIVEESSEGGVVLQYKLGDYSFIDWKVDCKLKDWESLRLTSVREEDIMLTVKVTPLDRNGAPTGETVEMTEWITPYTAPKWTKDFRVLIKAERGKALNTKGNVEVTVNLERVTETPPKLAEGGIK